MELEDNTCLVEHVKTQYLSIPANSRVQYTFPEVSDSIHLLLTKFCPLCVCISVHTLLSWGVYHLFVLWLVLG